MAAPGPCADGPCCSRSGARQTLDEMDFERGEAAAGAGGGPRGRSGAPVLGHRDPSGAWHELGHWKRRPGRAGSWARATWGLRPLGCRRGAAGELRSPGGCSGGAGGRAVRGLAFLRRGVRTVCAGDGPGGPRGRPRLPPRGPEK